MKNTVFFFLLFFNLFSHPALYAQIEQSVNYDCRYAALFNLDFDRGKDIREFEGKLIIRNQVSFFCMLATEHTYEKEEEENNITVAMDSIFKVVKNQQEGILYFSDILFNKKEVFYKDSLLKNKWDISNEKKMIDSIPCVKATTFFAGRSYTAWFAPSIPIQNGPWKLGSLPGLIVELYDQKKDLYFILKEMVQVDGLSRKELIPSIQTQLGYGNYVETGKKFIKKFIDAAKIKEVGCLTCESSTTIKFYLWEKVFE